MSESGMRRRPPAQGPLAAELRTVLAAAGLPVSESQERARARGLLVAEDGEGARVEWFVSLSLRESAAVEQREGEPAGRSTQLHSAARRCLHNAVIGLLKQMGYQVETEREGGVLLVRAARGGGPTTVAGDVQRVLAELARAGTGRAVDHLEG